MNTDSKQISLSLKSALRYGENPHQEAGFYINTDSDAPEETDTETGIGQATLVQGQKELSFNNLVDADTAWSTIINLPQHACAIIKHANPCGVAIGKSQAEAWVKAVKTDSESAFGGIVAFNSELTVDTAQAILDFGFLEVLIAPSYDQEALTMLAKRKNLRCLTMEFPHEDALIKPPRKVLTQISGGFLMQDADTQRDDFDSWKCVTKAQLPDDQKVNAVLAWEVVRWVKSNAIVFTANEGTIAIGAGQTSRVFAAKIAVTRANENKLDTTGSIVASDAFFPFRDGIDEVVRAGATCIIQPGGSVRDEECISAANESGVVMLFTGRRHFRH